MHKRCGAFLIMKTLLLAFLLPLTLFGQRLFSKEEQNYKIAHKYKKFEPTPLEVVRNAKPKYVRIVQTAGVPFSGEINDTFTKKVKRDMSFLDPDNLSKVLKESNARDEISRYTNDTGLTAILFLDSKYDEFQWGEPGYWVRIESKNDSIDYYMGLAQNYYFKLFDSGITTWRNDSILQFAALRVRLIDPFIHPVQAAKYETVDSNLSVEVTLSDLKRDSDGDGLTDIEEEKLLLNLNSKDTDRDGVSDYDDHNPRFKSVLSNETLLYKVILDNFIYFDEVVKIRDIQILDQAPVSKHTRKSRTRLIVTDDKNLQNVNVDHDQFIILTNDESKSYRIKYPISLDEITITPLFKVDNELNKFFISRYTDLGGEKYLVTKYKNGYDISLYEEWIH
jgi:hypothetical protein